MESHSIQAVLSVVDNNFTAGIKSAIENMEKLDEKTKRTSTSLKDAFKNSNAFKVLSSGVDILKDSLGGAVSRFDELNKYQNVMIDVGYSTSGASSAIEKLEQGIQNLPTSLDEIVSGTVELAASTGSLEKGTSTALALNNAFLASGASTEEASRAIELYSQMLAEGKVNSEAWQALQDTMPSAMEKVAKSFQDRGVTSVNDLYQALETGSITFDEFNNRMLELNEGVGGFADQAAKSNSGIETSFKGIQSSVESGLARSIQVLDEGLKNIGVDGIAGLMDKVSEAIDWAFKAFNDALPGIITGVANAIKFLSDNSSWLIPVLVLLGSAFLTVKTYLSAMSIISKIGAIVGQLTTAFSILSKVGIKTAIGMVTGFMGPIGWIIAAIAAVVAAFVYFYNTNEDFRNKVNEIWQAVVDFLKPIIQAISDFVQDIFGTLSEWWKQNQDTILSVVQSTWDVIKAIFEAVLPAIQLIVEVFLNFLEFQWTLWSNVVSGIVQVTWAIISNAFKFFLDLILSIVTNIFDQIKLIFDTVMKVIENIIKVVLSLIKGDWDGVLEGIKGIVGAFGDFLKGTFENIMKLVGNLVENGINFVKNIFKSLSEINLLEIGKAIIDGFVNGLTAAWEAGKKFIGGIGDWIKEHKGPITYDRKLLIPAGKAIMGGFNSSLIEGFKQVQTNVSGMAENLSGNMDLSGNIGAINGQIQSQVTHDVNMSNKTSPAEFNLNLGNRNYKLFVNDISDALGGQAELNLNF